MSEISLRASQFLHHFQSNTSNMTVDTVTLASGHKMPLVGFGLWKVPADKASDIVYNAIKVGYRLFDGAYDYQNEKEAGQGIKRAIDEGIVKREDIFVTTKLWNNYHKKEDALKMAKAQNEAWGLEYLDLYLIHFPIALPFIEPDKLRYPVSHSAHLPQTALTNDIFRVGGWMPNKRASKPPKSPCQKPGKP